MKPLETNDTSSMRVQALVCTNERPEGKACCKKTGSQELFDKLKEKLKAEGLRTTMRVTRTGCLGYCNDIGAVITIHSKGKPTRWFTEVTMADFDAIWREIVNS